MSSTSADITIKIQSLSGEECGIDTSLGATLTDVKAQIQKQLGHAPGSQKLLLDETPLVDTRIVLADLGIVANCMLTLVLQEPLGQSSLANADGEKESILPRCCPEGIREKLNEFEFMSWQAVCKAHEDHPKKLFMDWREDEAYFGACGLDFYWKTCSDGCRYEYWSSDPHDNEYGVLVRVDAESMVGIGMGNYDGLEIFEEFADGEAVIELIREGWPWPPMLPAA